MTQGYLIFHLNLAFSSIKTEARLDVIRNCYWPLLDLVESEGIPIGIELTGWTLQQIALLDKSWVERFRQLLENRQCELIGSGWSQVIGPLVPYEVNCWNQQLGMDAYLQILGVTPLIALVNEMAFSTGMVDVYVGVGYKGIIMDRDNVRLALNLDGTPLSDTPTHAAGCGNHSMPVLWSDSILFQRLQRVVHGDIPVTEYMAYVKQRAEQDSAVLPIYCNDAEIFDYRPGRFTAESRLHPEGEWDRFKRICTLLKKDLSLNWLSPSEALAIQELNSQPNIKRLTSASQPIPVKKQAKYNINRWAVTGRDDLWLNTACHRVYQALVSAGDVHSENQRELCELWASDLRTHITGDRWNELVKRVAEVNGRLNISKVMEVSGEYRESSRFLDEMNLPSDVQISLDEEKILWSIKTPNVHLILNARRGLAVQSLAFKSHDYEAVIGILPQGYFSSIELGADFYSGGVIIEMPGERTRMTDLDWVEPHIQCNDHEILVTAMVSLGYGVIMTKTVSIHLKTERVQFSYDFGQWKRPLGVVRVGIFTFLSESLTGPLLVRCVNGGKKAELFPLDRIVNHGNAASTLVSSTASFGATDGCLVIEDVKGRSLHMAWNPAVCAAMPMLQHQELQKHCFTRLSFSLCELDDTSRTEGRLMPFSVVLSPI